MTLLLLPQTFLKNADTVYWIGLQKTSFPWYDYGWLEEGEPDSDGITDAWFWVDGSLYDRYPRHGRAGTPCPDPFLRGGTKGTSGFIWDRDKAFGHHSFLPHASPVILKGKSELPALGVRGSSPPRASQRRFLLRCLEPVGRNGPVWPGARPLPLASSGFSPKCCWCRPSAGSAGVGCSPSVGVCPSRPWQSKLNGSCAVISRGNIKPAPCEAEDDLHLWICEKAAGPSSPLG